MWATLFGQMEASWDCAFYITFLNNQSNKADDANAEVLEHPMRTEVYRSWKQKAHTKQVNLPSCKRRMLVFDQECTGNRAGLQLLPRLVPSYSTINTRCSWAGNGCIPTPVYTEKRWAGNTHRNRENRGWTSSVWLGWSFHINVLFTLMNIAYKISVHIVLFDPEAFFILASLSNQPVDYQSFFDSTLL